MTDASWAIGTAARRLPAELACLPDKRTRSAGTARRQWPGVRRAGLPRPSPALTPGQRRRRRRLDLVRLNSAAPDAQSYDYMRRSQPLFSSSRSQVITWLTSTAISLTQILSMSVMVVTRPAAHAREETAATLQPSSIWCLLSPCLISGQRLLTNCTD